MLDRSIEVVISSVDKSDRPTGLVDSVLHKICAAEKKQDWRKGRALWQLRLLEFGSADVRPLTTIVAVR